jgi:tetratricopeptide (TPR) repeat protein
MTCRELVIVAALLGARSASAEDGKAGAAADTADEASRAIDRRLTERLTRLAEHHYRAGAYYRAISAYEELALFATDPATRLAAAIRIAMSYHHGHQLDAALPAYRAALAQSPDDDTAQALRIQLAIARVERGLAQPGAEALDAIAAELTPSAAGGTHRALALYQLARIDGLAGRRDAAHRSAASLDALCQPRPSTMTSSSTSPSSLASAPVPGACAAAPVLALALARPPAPRRSPWLGVTMSLVVPGSGSVYGGHLVDGAYYFALTALSGLGALDVHDGSRRWSDQRATFYGLAALAAIFYAGSAVQGYVSVARHNAIQARDARATLWRRPAAAARARRGRAVTVYTRRNGRVGR